MIQIDINEFIREPLVYVRRVEKGESFVIVDNGMPLAELCPVVMSNHGNSKTLKGKLQSCAKKFPDGNPHGEIDLGPPVGREIW